MKRKWGLIDSTVVFNAESISSQAYLLIPVILRIWKLMQKDHYEFQFSLHYIMRLLKNKNGENAKISGGSQLYSGSFSEKSNRDLKVSF